MSSEHPTSPESSSKQPTVGDSVADEPLQELPPVLEAEGPASLVGRVKTILIGQPRDLADTAVFRHVSLVALLAWVGLGADGLSSSCYGPSEAFFNLGEHGHLAIFLALATIATVLVISLCYSHIIEEFPSGGGGYLVASKLLGRPMGVVSGCALVVDYVLTVTVSIAAAGDALFGLMGSDWTAWKLSIEYAAIILLIVMNLRGVRESVLVLLPIFLIFLLTHILVIGGAIGLHITGASEVVMGVGEKIHHDLTRPDFGLWAMLTLLLHAYSLGAGTYTGIEAVSNSMPVMREPRVQTAKRTMAYMATSLSLTAGGLMIAYLLLGIVHSPDKTMNQLLAEQFTRDLGFSDGWLPMGFVFVTMISEGALLFAAAQAGFIDGPRVLANMAHDSYMPHWLGNLSERLANHNGVFLIGGSALAALWLTGGNVTALVIMYSINVFLTFSLSMLGMCRHWWRLRRKHPLGWRRLALFVFGATMCLSILVVTTVEKFHEGGWKTLAVTGSLIGVSFLVHRYYAGVAARLKQLGETFSQLSVGTPTQADPDPNEPVAAILVGGYGGLGIHTMLNTVRFAPNHFKSMVFVSAAIVDSGNFKGADALDDLKRHTEEALGRYVDLARGLGVPATSYMSVGTDVVEELERLCQAVKKKYPKAVVFAGQLVFQRDRWYQRFLHNQTAYFLQRRLHWDGIPMVILPTRVR